MGRFVLAVGALVGFVLWIVGLVGLVLGGLVGFVAGGRVGLVLGAMVGLVRGGRVGIVLGRLVLGGFVRGGFVLGGFALGGFVLGGLVVRILDGLRHEIIVTKFHTVKREDNKFVSAYLVVFVLCGASDGFPPDKTDLNSSGGARPTESGRIWGSASPS